MRPAILQLSELANWSANVILTSAWTYQQKADCRMVLRWRAASLYYEAKQKHSDSGLLQSKM